MIPSTLITWQQVKALYPQSRRRITLNAYWDFGEQKIPHLRLFGRVYFRLQDVEAWMAEKVLARVERMREKPQPAVAVREVEAGDAVGKT